MIIFLSLYSSEFAGSKPLAMSLCYDQGRLKTVEKKSLEKCDLMLNWRFKSK